jgi:hypothetical protein
MLMFQKPHRLSIDIDIIVSPRYNDIDAILHSICDSNGFSRFECQQRASMGDIPAKHYKFYYHSAVEDKEASVLLDVLLRRILIMYLLTYLLPMPLSTAKRLMLW